MKYKLLSVNKVPFIETRNIGDYIQALAASQYYPQIDGFIDREELDEYEGEEAKVIMNGWYMHSPEHWPPTDRIRPLLVSFHICSAVKDFFTAERSLAWLKKHEPVGCRDKFTEELLGNCGIRTWFSACLTLTLGMKYHSDEKDDKTYIVDPIIPRERGVKDIRQLLYSIFHIYDICRLLKTTDLFIEEDRPGRLNRKYRRYINMSLYHRLYSKIVSRKVLMGSEYISQSNAYYNHGFTSDFGRLKEAERLVRLYSRAKLVITSRIHCALPCTGLETPVIFLKMANDIPESACRMGGILDFLNVVEISKKGGAKPLFSLKGKLSAENHPENKTGWKPFAEDLKNRCCEFMKD